MDRDLPAEYPYNETGLPLASSRTRLGLGGARLLISLPTFVRRRPPLPRSSRQRSMVRGADPNQLAGSK